MSDSIFLESLSEFFENQPAVGPVSAVASGSSKARTSSLSDAKDRTREVYTINAHHNEGDNYNKK